MVFARLVPRVYSKGTVIFEQGEIGTCFYIVASGQVEVVLDGRTVRTLARHGHFGERALLFEEPRTASVRVRSPEAELWCLEKAAFVEVLTDHLREEIMRRIEIQAGATWHVAIKKELLRTFTYVSCSST